LIFCLLSAHPGIHTRKSRTIYLEGIVARTIEEQTAKLPSDIFLWGALGSIGISLYFELNGETQKSSFVSRWVSPFLLLGVYNKLVKLSGSDRVNR
jgi:hypothetical protein